MAEPTQVVSAHEKYGLPLAFDDAREELLTGGFDGSIGRFSTDGWTEQRHAKGHDQSVNCGGLTPGGALVTGSTDTTAKVWELPALTESCTFDGHSKTVADLAIHPTGDRVATASYDSTVRVWSTDTGAQTRLLEGHPGNVTCVTFVDDGASVAAGGLGVELLVWSLEDGSELARLGGHGQAVVGVTVDQDGLVWSVGYNGTVHSWSADDWTAQDSYDLPIETRPTGLAAHPSESRLAVSRDGGVTLLSTRGELVVDHETSIKGISTPLWSPDGHWLSVGGADGKVRLYEY